MVPVAVYCDSLVVIGTDGASSLGPVFSPPTQGYVGTSDYVRWNAVVGKPAEELRSKMVAHYKFSRSMPAAVQVLVIEKVFTP